MLNNRVIPALALAIMFSSGAAFAADHDSGKHIRKHEHGLKHEEQIQAKCDKEYSGDQAKINKCVEAKGDFSKVDSSAKSSK